MPLSGVSLDTLLVASWVSYARSCLGPSIIVSYLNISWHCAAAPPSPPRGLSVCVYLNCKAFLLSQAISTSWQDLFRCCCCCCRARPKSTSYARSQHTEIRIHAQPELQLEIQIQIQIEIEINLPLPLPATTATVAALLR